MKFVILFIILFNLSSAQLKRLSPKIIGGREAEEDELPYMVSIRRAEIELLFGITDHICGGSILNSDTVLTARHCLYDPFGNYLEQPGSYFVVAGSNRMRTELGEYFVVSKIYGHPQYYTDENSLDGDIAVLKVAPNFIFTSSIQPILINENNNLVPGTNCSVHGWGYLLMDSPLLPDVLQTVDLQIANFDDCNQTYNGILSEHHICAYADGKDSCCGDSGGPLVCNGFLSGIVSFGDGCALPNIPGVYTKVSSYQHFIENYNNFTMSSSLRASLSFYNILVLIFVWFK